MNKHKNDHKQPGSAVYPDPGSFCEAHVHNIPSPSNSRWDKKIEEKANTCNYYKKKRQNQIYYIVELCPVQAFTSH